MKIHLIGICGTGMGSLAGLLKAAGHDVRGSDEHVYPPMSTQLAEQKIPVFEGSARQPRLGARRGGGRQRLPQGSGRGAGRAGAPDPARVVPLAVREAVSGRERRTLASSSPGRTARRPPSSLLAHVLADAGRDPSFLIGGVPLNFRQSWRLGAGERVRRRRRRVRHRLLRQGVEVPALPAADRAPDLGRVRSRRHLPRRGGGAGRVPEVRGAHPRGRPAGRLRGLARARWRWRASRAARSSPTGAPARAPTGPSRSSARVDRRADHAGAGAAGRAGRHRRDEPPRHLQPREPDRRHGRRLQPGDRAAGRSRAACGVSWACGGGRRCAASRAA